MTRQIQMLDVMTLQPDPRNPKTHKIDTITASVGRFGYVEPVVIDQRTGYIVSGHGRTTTLQQMLLDGVEAPEGVQVSDGKWLVPVVVGWASKNETEAVAALIALNRTTEVGGWDDDALLNLLNELTELPEDGFAGVGYTEADRLALEALAADADPERFNRVEFDAAQPRLDETEPVECPRCHTRFRLQGRFAKAGEIVE